MKKRLLSLTRSPWVAAAILLAVFFLSTSYKYGWDDQHLEIPLLKHLIDNTLYQGDYYVESLKENFSSYFYPLLSKLTDVQHIPTVYFFLYLVSRYFLFFWMYKIWASIGRHEGRAFACVLTFILVIRVDEFLYRTFSHQEFTLPIIFSGIYYFFRGRFLLASAIFGVAANFHALYSLFPFLFLLLYLMISARSYGYKLLFKSVGVFFLFCLPFFIWTIHSRLGSSMQLDFSHQENWLSLFIKACPQNFFFPQAPRIPFSQLWTNGRIFFHLTQSYLYIALLFLLNIFFHPLFRRNRRAVSFCLGAFGLLFVCFMGTYVYPHRFIIDLNLTRNTQFLLFLLGGYTTLLAFQMIEKHNIVIALCFGILFSLQKLTGQIALFSAGGMFSLGLGIYALSQPLYKKYFFMWMAVSLAGGCIYGIIHSFYGMSYSPVILRTLAIIGGLLLINTGLFLLYKNKSYAIIIRQLFIFIPLVVFLGQFSIYRYHRVQKERHGGGFWELQRSWEDIQEQTRRHTPKDALILVPYDMEMGGFRILSERKIIASYRDCGIIGFDYKAAQQWRERIADIESFKFIVKQFPKKALQKAIVKYRADYVVFMKYAAPPKKNKIFQHIYSNKYFSLFKVLKF